MDPSARPSVTLRMGTNEDPSQMMPPIPGFGPPMPGWNPQPPGMNQSMQMPLGGGGGYGVRGGGPPLAAASQRFPSVGSHGSSPWGNSSSGMGMGASMEKRRSSFEMNELRGQLQGQYAPYGGAGGQQHQGGPGDEDSTSCISDGPSRDGNRSRGNSQQFSNHCASQYGMSQQAAGDGQPGASQSSTGSQRSGASMAASLSSSSECRRFTPVQVYKATDSFSEGNILGHGAFGSVFKGKLMGCQVAVKRLEGGGWQGPAEYRTEVEVLSHMRHPHIVLLMGHCPEEHCLVYEFLPGGSLQDFLNPARRRRQLMWAERIRILSEITSALLYLHHHEPPIAHRDLKPDNVLLDSNMTSKLGDVGLARLVVEDDSNMTARVRGTAGYIDPEEVVTCEVSVLSDIYAFGLIALQLLLGEPNVKAIQKLLNDCANAAGGTLMGRGLSMAADTLMGKLDSTCGAWNRDIARQMVVMALRCSDQKRMRRPDIAEEIQPALARAAEEAAEELQKQRVGLEAQLVCPLSQNIMTDPVVAADGFTYERSAIETWLSMNDTSPSTGEPMHHKFLTPNNGLKQLLDSR